MSIFYLKLGLKEGAAAKPKSLIWDGFCDFNWYMKVDNSFGITVAFSMENGKLMESKISSMALAVFLWQMGSLFLGVKLFRLS